jgi:hypothetical protein
MNPHWLLCPETEKVDSAKHKKMNCNSLGMKKDFTATPPS